MLWENLREEEFEEAIERSKGVCVLPIGCLEKHGPHSPLGTDTIHAAEITRLAAEKEPLVVFPTMYFGEKSGAGEFPGTVIFSVETRWHIFRETCNEIYRNGFKKIMFVNSHGGNSAMLGAFTRAMMQENPNILIFNRSANTSWGSCIDRMAQDEEAFPYLTEEDRAALKDYREKGKVMGHACFGETALIMHYTPELLDMDRVMSESGDSIHRFDDFKPHGITTPLGWMADYPNSYHASNEYVLNERIAKAFAETQIDAMAKAYAFLKNETISTEYHAEWLQKQ